MICEVADHGIRDRGDPRDLLDVGRCHGPRQYARASRARQRPAPGSARPDRPAPGRCARDAGVRRAQGRRRGGALRARRAARRRCRSSCTPRGAPAGAAACCSCSRGWTRRARAARSATSSGRSTRRACTSSRSGRRRPRSGGTTSSGASAAQLPRPGKLGVFDRSHYEDVVAVRVRGLVDRAHVDAPLRLDQPLRGRSSPRAGRASSSASCTSPRTSSARGCWPASTTRPSTGSSTPATSTTASAWDEYLVAYADALERCNTEAAPWYVVPADRKWYRNWAITNAADRAARGDGAALARAAVRRGGAARRLLAIP